MNPNKAIAKPVIPISNPKHWSGNGYVDYVKGANIAGFVKVADAMIDQGLV